MLRQFFPSYKKKFVTKFLIHITKFVTHVRKFVTNFFLADSKKKLAEREYFLQGNKKLLGDN